MAEFFGELAARALAISGLAVLLSVILPKGGMRDCARLVLGVMLVASLIEPVVEIIPAVDRAAVSAEIFTDWQSKGRDSTEEIIAAGGRIAENAEGVVREELAEDLERQIAAMVCRNDGVADCKVSVEFADEVTAVSGGSNNWGQVFIVLSMTSIAEGAQVAEKIAEDIAAFYDIAAASVRVSVVEY